MNSIASPTESSPRAGLSLRQVHVRWLITLAVACGAMAGSADGRLGRSGCDIALDEEVFRFALSENCNSNCTYW